MRERQHRHANRPARSPRARKQLGQHFLQPAWADKLVTAIAPKKQDQFVEIGPGPGALTLKLAPHVARLTAIEVDPRMIATLRPLAPPNVDLIEADFLDVDLGSLLPDADLRIAGNLPYNLSSPILFKLLRTYRDRGRLLDATLMLQREVAERIESEPGTKEYGTLSIFVQLRAHVRRLLTLPPGAFRPAPKVHSVVLRLEFHPPEIGLRDEATFEAMVRSVFTQRRKTLSNALGRFAEERGLPAKVAVASAELDGTRRPETLQLTELARLADVFISHSQKAVL